MSDFNQIGKSKLDGKEEKNTGEVVFCRGVKKLLALEDCNKDNCSYCGGILVEPIMGKEVHEKDLKQVGAKRSVICHFPKLEKILMTCEVK